MANGDFGKDSDSSNCRSFRYISVRPVISVVATIAGGAAGMLYVALGNSPGQDL